MGPICDPKHRYEPKPPVEGLIRYDGSGYRGSSYKPVCRSTWELSKERWDVTCKSRGRFYVGAGKRWTTCWASGLSPRPPPLCRQPSHVLALGRGPHLHRWLMRPFRGRPPDKSVRDYFEVTVPNIDRSRSMR